MYRFILLSIAAILLAPSTAAGDPAGDRGAEQHWPQWRGPRGTGVAPHADPPVEWGEGTTPKNIRWKTPLPGIGHSTPIVWGHDIFLTAAVPYGDPLPPRYSGAPGAHDNLPVTQHHEFVVLAVDRRDGKLRWRRTVHTALPHEGGHVTGSLASASPVTDGEHLFAFFGSRGIYCLDRDGTLQWQKNFGVMQTKHGHGEGSSPVLFGKTLVVNWDHEGQSFIVALDKRTGEQRWKVVRDEVTSWATPIVVPIVVQHGEEAQVIVSGTGRTRGYDLATGEVVWQCGGLSANIVASPVAGGGMVFAGSSYEMRALMAIRLDEARGDVTGSDHVVWTRLRGTPYVPSPLLYDDALYFLTHYQGILTRVDARTGEDRPGAFRLPGIRNVYASPVAAANRVYVTDLEGTTLVIHHGPLPRILAVNRLDDSFAASAALVGRDLLLRGQQFLYCITEESATKSE